MLPVLVEKLSSLPYNDLPLITLNLIETANVAILKKLIRS